MCYRENPSFFGYFSHRRRYYPKGGTKPGKRTTNRACGAGNSLIAQGEIRLKAADAPQIYETVMKSVVNHEMSFGDDSSDLVRSGDNLRSHDAETCFHAKLA
jgi:hypothetical protein